MSTRKQRPAEDQDREDRIAEEIIVDAHDEYERVTGWLTYLEDCLDCPFTAECVREAEVSPLRKGEKVRVLKIVEMEEPTDAGFLVQIEWQGRKMGVPLSQLSPVDADDETIQAVEDWRYWVDRGYLF